MNGTTLHTRRDNKGGLMDVATLEWRDEPIDTDGNSIFVIGGINGCVMQLELLLREIRRHASEVESSHIVFLGDLVSKGPHSIHVLEFWASEDFETQHIGVHRLFGNHEQMLMIVANDLQGAAFAKKKFFSIGGDKFDEEQRRKVRDPSASISRKLLRAATSEAVLSKLDNLQGHPEIRKSVFVHGGIDPSMSMVLTHLHPARPMRN